MTVRPGDASAFVALRHRNFRLLWLGQLVSMSGTMMQGAAILWHISLLAPPGWKALALGMVGLARLGPILVFGLWSGVVADAVDRRRLMMAAQIVMMLAATMLALVTAWGLANAGVVLLLAGMGAAAGAVDGPARQALLPSLVPREHLPNAIGLNSILFQTASVVGPAVAGLALAATGVATVYALNALSFLAVIAALLLMRGLPPTAPAPRGAISFRALGEGVRFVFGKSLIRSTMLLDGLATFFCSATALLPLFAQDVLQVGPRGYGWLYAAPAIGAVPLGEGIRFVFGMPLIRSTLLLDGLATFFCSATALLPLFAQDVLQVGPRGYGWLYAAPAIGAVLTSAVMVRLADRIRRRGMVLVWAVAVYGLATVVFGLSQTFWLMFVALAATGAADTVSAVLRNIVRQLETPDRLRGRMVGISMLFFMGGPQLGEFEAGLVAQWLGAGVSVIAGGVASLATTAWIAWRTPALRAYCRSG